MNRCSICFAFCWVFFSLAPASAQKEVDPALQAEIETVLARFEERISGYPSGLYFRGKNFRKVDRDGVLEEAPCPDEFEVWLGGSIAAPQVRILWLPKVGQWSDGGAPWWIAPEAEVSEGEKVRSIEANGNDDLMQTSSLSIVPAGAWLHRVSGGLEGFPEKFPAFLRAAMKSDEDQFTWTAEVVSWHDSKRVIRVEYDTGTLNAIYWFDAERDYVVRKWDESQKAGDSFYQRAFVADELFSIGEDWWFFKRARASLDIIQPTGPVREWEHRYEIDEAKIEPEKPTEFFSVESTRAALLEAIDAPRTIEWLDEIGGRVVDESGEGIASVALKLIATLYNADGRVERTRQFKATTDTRGDWEIDLPEGYGAPVKVQADHPGYVKKSYLQDYRMRTSQPFSALADGTSVIVLEGGARITGIVTGPAGKPVVGAKILPVDSRFRSHPDIRTDEAGEFQLPPSSDAYQHVSVLADGFAPATKRVAIEANGATEVSFELEPPHTLRLRVVDESGDPVAGVSAIAERWKELQIFDFRARSDAEGRIVWRNAPPDPVTFDLLKGATELRRLPLTASEEEIEVRLVPALRIEGTIRGADEIDAPMFLTIGRKIDEGDSIYWEKDTRRKLEGDRFDVELENFGWIYFLKLEAEGYAPRVSPGIQAAQQVEEVEIGWD